LRQVTDRNGSSLHQAVLNQKLKNVETVIQITNADTIGFVSLDALQLQSIKPELKTNE
jgi:hypothetical protein